MNGEVAVAGEVEITKSVTVQVQQYHPVVTTVALRLPIEEGESPKKAIRRVRAIVEEELDIAVEEVCRDGMKWRAR